MFVYRDNHAVENVCGGFINDSSTNTTMEYHTGTNTNYSNHHQHQVLIGTVADPSTDISTWSIDTPFSRTDVNKSKGMGDRIFKEWIFIIDKDTAKIRRIYAGFN